MPRRDALLLTEIVDAAVRIVAIVDRLDPDNPASDRDLLDALLWNYVVLGEAAGQVSSETKAAHPQVPWLDSVRLRNRIVHGYWSIDLDVLVSTAHEDLPALLEEVRLIQEDA